MTFAKFVCVLLVMTLLVTAVQPARAEALEPIFIGMIISGVVVVVALVAILIIANVSEGRRRRSGDETPERAAPFVALDIATPGVVTPVAEGP